MAKVRLKASAESIAKGGQDRGDFVTPKPGFYILTLAEVNSGYSKDDSGEEDKKKPRLEMIYKITGVGREEAEPKENYGNIWDYVSFSKESDWKRGEVIKAFGLAADDSGDFDDEVDTDELINRKVLARIKHEKSRDKNAAPRAKIASLHKYGTDPSDIEETSGVDYGGDEDETFSEPTDEETTEETQDLTEEELEAMDLKELGAKLTELTEEAPQDYIVKKGSKVDAEKTKAAVIARILEWQGTVTDDGDDEDPF